MASVSALRVLTVCTGNVCRSPAAAVMLREAVTEAGLADRIEVGSAGTSWEAEGMPMDDRTVLALERAGYSQPFDHTARAVHLSELKLWDIVLPMTPEHAASLQRTVDQIPEGEKRPEIALWGQFDPRIPANAPMHEVTVPDPWYEGQKAFDRTITGMQRALPSLLCFLRARLDGPVD